MGQEKQRSKVVKIVGIVGITALMIAVLGFVFYPPSRQQTATISTPILSENFTCYSYVTSNPDSCPQSWPTVTYRFVLNYGWVIQVKVLTSDSLTICPGFASCYSVTDDVGYGNPPNIQTYTITHGGDSNVEISLRCIPTTLTSNCPTSFSGQIVITRSG
ncbi:MAG: hypothetical protein AUJ07_10460 [Crenarchaeota archaeon 13_1_40CM_3_53_5]|nr:MAG: hypothetical protein AUJ07_10460 [Crenarchaeota archaeon 13_1_40CM_3_53_5]